MISIIQTLRYIYYWVAFHMIQLAVRMKWMEPIKQVKFLDDNNRYIEPLKTRFLATFESKKDFNANIEPIFYDKPAFETLMKESGNDVEKIWKTRILLENTPRGNILMYYDAYKMGFSFYCDQKTVSHDILNGMAMKYVSMYRCRHFFIDETFLSKEQLSPFIKLYFIVDTKKMQSNAFTKTKKETIVPKKQETSPLFAFWQTKKIEAPQPMTTEPEKLKNKFIYVGKMANASFLQSIPKPRKVLAKFSSPVLESIKGDMSYKSFKQSLSSR